MIHDVNETIVDSSTPNAGRIYDYLIGGHHHFEVDRKASEKVIENFPLLPKVLKLVRWFLQEAISHCSEEGFRQFIDFASGLPVEDHIHNNTPKGTKVIYSDIDPVTVQYGRKLIGNNPDVKYESCNAGTPEILLESETVKILFGKNHKAAIGFTGICWFLSNEQISHAMKVLYDWADKGTVIYISDMDCERMTEVMETGMELYKNMKQPVYLRSKEQLIELIKPWEVDAPGFLPFEEWIPLSKSLPSITKESIETAGAGTFGGFIRK